MLLQLIGKDGYVAVEWELEDFIQGGVLDARGLGDTLMAAYRAEVALWAKVEDE